MVRVYLNEQRDAWAGIVTNLEDPKNEQTAKNKKINFFMINEFRFSNYENWKWEMG